MGVDRTHRFTLAFGVVAGMDVMEGSQLEQPSTTQDNILETATRLFSSQGYESTSLSQVAKEANVSKALIFWHFENKETLFRAALRRAIEPYFIKLDKLEGLDEWGRMERLIDLFYEFVQENVYSVRFLFTLILQSDRQPDEAITRVNELYRAFRSLLADVIESGRASGCFRSDVQPTLDASVILAALVGILIEHFMSGEWDSDPSQLLDHLKRTAQSRLKQ
jgi:AcrR family transcriptional regulator